uniref:Interferon-inducible double-stranded RNA-dependent protein kinase activator A homolog A-like n=1 Tax=Geotrypetes seraphini TaxID=260995 RepID=A0A6P8R6G9_GEOSA|nr:interferon-inducible double-stranded RNA-dependent protein kinase activator A homolog A-like [Geotrypetes seraphini]
MFEERFLAAPKRSSGKKKPLSLEEMIAANPGKDPVQLLYEYGTKMRKLPAYDFEKVEGQERIPVFISRVALGDVICTVWYVIAVTWKHSALPSEGAEADEEDAACAGEHFKRLKDSQWFFGK